MKITVERNSGADSETIPYCARIEIVTITVDAGSVFQVPVYVTYAGQQKIYDLEICGFRAETKNLQDVPVVTERLLTGLINMARLPSYVFIARRAGGIYPVYTVDSEVFATTPGGPVFRHVELAKVREYLSDYLHEAGILGEKGLSDKLHVRKSVQPFCRQRRRRRPSPRRPRFPATLLKACLPSGYARCIVGSLSGTVRRPATAQRVLLFSIPKTH